jgi:hypothetical protein
MALIFVGIFIVLGFGTGKNRAAAAEQEKPADQTEPADQAKS